MNRFDQIDKARNIMGITEMATYKEIRLRYIELSKRFHPDIGGKSHEMLKINKAYEVIKEYIECYNYSFRKIDVLNTYPELLYDRFYKDQK